PPLVSVRADATGAISTSFVIPATYGGSHRIHAVGQTSKLRTAQTLTVGGTATLNPTTGQAQQTVMGSVAGFRQNESVSFYWDGSGTAAATGTTNGIGRTTFTVKAPWTNGAHSGVVKGGTTKLTSNVSFGVQAKIKLTPTTGDGSDGITVRGTGFVPATTVN